MYFLFSGEGPTDLGGCTNPVAFCEGEEFAHGPLVMAVDQIVFARHNYSILEAGCFGFVPKAALIYRASEIKAAKKTPDLPGPKRARETMYFYKNARALSRIALDLQNERNDEVIVVFFRDSDGTASARRTLRNDMVQSMLNGFEEEGFGRGVPMIPKPKSEAWLLCALTKQYVACDALEERSGNDNSPNSLKNELENHFGAHPSREELCDLVLDGTIDFQQINMPSFIEFKQQLEEVI